jgi:hypothetical protein
LGGPRTKPQVTPPQSTPHYPNARPPARRLAKTEPPLLVFGFLTQNPPPLVCRSISASHLLNLALPHPNQLPTTQIQSPPHVVRKNQAPAAQFRFLGPNPLPLARRSITWTQHPNPGLPHPNQLPTTQIRGPLRVIHSNRAPAAQFSVFSPNPLPLAHRSIAWTQHPNPGLPHPK